MSSMSIDLSGRVAAVTGARRGIGRTISLVLAQAGAAVAVTDISQEDCQKVVEEIKSRGGRGLAIKCDVTSRQEVEAMVGRVIEEFGRLDILVNNAGVVSTRPFMDLSEEEWDRTLTINLKGPFLCSQAAARDMLKRKWGRIINISSISSGGCGLAFPFIVHYTASKGGLSALSDALARELTPHGINVNSIAPGVIDTEMATDAKESGQVEQLLARVPKHRMGKPEEIAYAVAFLASEQADYISGASLVVDGGWLTT